MDFSKKNPLKSWVKMVCQALYCLGVGDCWYEDKSQSNLQKLLYYIWMIITNFYNLSLTINISLAHLRTDLDEKEQNDLVQLTLSNISIAAKIFFLYLHKNSIQKVLPRVLESFRSVIVCEELEKASVRKSAKISFAIVGGTFSAMLGATIDGIKAHFDEGIPIRTEVTYYPSKWDSGLPVNILRFFIQFHWWYTVSIMAAIDSICISSLVIVAHKFKVLQVYFTNLREKVLENAKTKSRTELEKEFRTDFVIGIKMHEDALWCAKNVQHALGNLYSVQIVESVVLLVMCLIKLVSAERNLIFLLANFAYILSLIFLTGAYMMPAGDITYEASMVSTAMFHSGWEFTMCRETRVLAVLALQRSQAPVTMNAFGILMLSYSNFISVIRSSYSFFAVMY